MTTQTKTVSFIDGFLNMKGQLLSKYLAKKKAKDERRTRVIKEMNAIRSEPILSAWY